MKTRDRLYQEALVRLGPDEMKGIDSLISEGHTGIAERHTVGKFIAYVKDLEKQLGLHVPDPNTTPGSAAHLKVNSRNGSYFIPMGK